MVAGFARRGLGIGGLGALVVLAGEMNIGQVRPVPGRLRIGSDKLRVVLFGFLEIPEPGRAGAAKLEQYR